MQIIGWREYINGIYWLRMPEYRSSNYFGFERPLPQLYWEPEKTDLACLRDSVTMVRETAYAHHIHRLMVLSNFATLAGVHPLRLSEWFWAGFADAMEWVELPNVVGMATYADGGLLASKPYVSGAACIDRMSNYCGGCRYNPKARTGENACPFNYLYWTFLDDIRRRNLDVGQRMALAFKSAERIPPAELSLAKPYDGFHGMTMSEESTVAAFALRARREGLRDFGATMAPMTAFQILQGLETLHLRMPKHVENTRKIVAFLTEHRAVASVSYPELASHPDHAVAKRLLPNGAGAVVSFDLKGGRPAGKVFIEKLNLFWHLANIGDAKSLVIHPASTTHFRMDAAALKAAGIGEGTIRLSIGIEGAEDLLEDLSRALAAAEKAA